MMEEGKRYLLFLGKAPQDMDYYYSVGVNYGTISLEDDGRDERVISEDGTKYKELTEDTRTIWEEAKNKYIGKCSFPKAFVNNAIDEASYNNETLTAEDDSAIRQLATDACEDFVRFLRRDIDIECDYSNYVDNKKLNEYLKKRTQYFMIHPGRPQKTTYEITDVSINPDCAIVKGKLAIEEWGRSNNGTALGESQFCIEKHDGRFVITDWYITDDETENEFRPGYKIEKNIGFWN